ncbi:MAG TPA: CAP domain-containing protein [Candidatus Baltobacteraceae bacterium]|nr:CAP domain-containing protein [Candidatus Baltobacteraceae bacterium]
MLHALMLAAALHPAAAVQKRESRAATKLYAALNLERREHGLPALPLDPALQAAALDHVVDMARLDYFDHDSPAGVTPWDRMRSHDCTFSYAGENIALAGSGIQAASALFESPPHRANILSPHFTRVGIAVMLSDDGRLLFVEDFAG